MQAHAGHSETQIKMGKYVVIAHGAPEEVGKTRGTLAVTKHQGMKVHACCVSDPIDGRKDELKPANQPIEITKGTRIL